MLTTGLFVYAATSPVNGYAGGALYSQLGGQFVARLSCDSCPHMCRPHMKGLKNKRGEGVQNLQDSGGPFGFVGINFPGGILILKKEKLSPGIGKNQFSNENALRRTIFILLQKSIFKKIHLYFQRIIW